MDETLLIKAQADQKKKTNKKKSDPISRHPDSQYSGRIMDSSSISSIQPANQFPPTSADPSNTEQKPEKGPKYKKKMEPINKDTNDPAASSFRSQGFFSNLFPSPRWQSNSETAPPSPSTSSSATTTTVTTNLSDAKVSDSCTTVSTGSSGSNQSDSIESSNKNSNNNNNASNVGASAPVKRHTGGDCRWEAIRLANSRDSPLGLPHFKLLKRLGYGDIGSVYLVELRGTRTYFAMKVMDRASLVSRNKLLRAQTERKILSLLDHPFLPTLYTHFETEKFSCIVMEYCSGGNLHSLRQKQPNKYFKEPAARFYASEVLLALEYLHMLGIVYRDLKPENVLVREEGHIMLSDFDLSLQCSVSPTLVKSSSVHVTSSSNNNNNNNNGMLDSDHAVQGCIQPSVFFPRILPKRNRKTKSDFGVADGSLPELMAEPTNARSMSFVGTHEYLAPEIIRGEGHGSAVDWWTFGIFLYELLHGTTPFKGNGNRATLCNVVAQPLRFPENPAVSLAARDLIRGLLVKDPQRRIAYRRGATEIKQHPFFEGVNWALVRSAMPPHEPEPVDFSQFASKEKKSSGSGSGAIVGSSNNRNGGNNKGDQEQSKEASYLDFEYF